MASEESAANHVQPAEEEIDLQAALLLVSQSANYTVPINIDSNFY